MSTFHDDKIWQMAFTALLDLLEITEEDNSDVVSETRKEAMTIVTILARAISTKRRPEPGLTASVRSLLSVLWAREILTDDEFAKLDSAYEALANKLPR